ncbi:TRAP transporter small permease [Roseovarius sp.]|jgi:TRAP-type C4-dicarboxylate transport system permease small subunit|uniref:TRAP transporter small permease n=1 Tax=Roseovarius sp. TaxID=1486281 RepID=UPI002608EFDF|nr:TRAP transporter small permease [Roseovarius sp.]MDM8165895.1 TRAP transporter small permease [Roseovarius sp.]
MTSVGTSVRKAQSLLETLAMILAGIVLLTMGLIIVASILGKLLFLRPIPDDLLMVGLLNVAVIVLPLAYVERMRGHITVTVTTDWLGTRALGALRVFGALAMAVFFGGIGIMVAGRMPSEIAKGAYYDGVLQVPTWPMKAVFGAAILLFVARLVLSMIDGVHTIVTGRDDAPTETTNEEV